MTDLQFDRNLNQNSASRFEQKVAARGSACPICSQVKVSCRREVFDDRYGFPQSFKIYQCSQCQHQFVPAEISGETIQDLYTKYYPRSDFDVSRLQPFRYEPGIKSWLKGEKRAYGCVPPHVRVLDIGCGMGETLLYHVQRGCDAYGVEADRNAEKAKQSHGLNIKISMFNSSLFSPHFFDYVTLDQVIEHFTDPIATLKDIRKVVKRGGKVVLTTPNGQGWGARIFGKKWIHWHIPYHLHFFSKKSLQSVAEQSGFRLKSLSTVTSSEWLYYQQLSMLHFPKQGESSAFWKREPGVASNKLKQEKALAVLRKTGINHAMTRAFDALGVGDNFLAVLEASKS